MNHLRCRFFLPAVRVALVGLGLTVAAMAAATETIFTWIDDDGVQHFSAQPPEGRDYRIVQMLGSGAVPAADEADSAPAASPPPRLSEISPGQPDPDVVRERCAQARDNLEILMQDRPLLMRQEDGEPQPLDDEARQQLIDEAQSFIDEWCR